jgi:DNA-binding MurR/RpiR family transcriptional regulator
MKPSWSLAGYRRPCVVDVARWVLAHSEVMAFRSVRGQSEISGANVNTVYRLSLALGFAGFEDCRRAFQSALRRRGDLHGARAARLSEQTEDARIERLKSSAHGNLGALFAPDNVARIAEAAALLLAARRIHCIGVRSCFALAHYLANTGGMAFPNFERSLSEPGSIAGRIALAGGGEAVVPITFSL